MLLKPISVFKQFVASFLFFLSDSQLSNSSNIDGNVKSHEDAILASSIIKPHSFEHFSDNNNVLIEIGEGVKYQLHEIDFFFRFESSVSFFSSKVFSCTYTV